ncbi:MAG TPA: inositol monophosphatase family protein [Mycobacteriales bacterium]|nr:inositol monophosphatase family protein [Mycobacteriales bacterium]
MLELAVVLAHRAAAVLRERPAELDVSTKSSPTDVVTVMDRAAERVIVEGLAAARPSDAVVSEEGAGRSGTSGVSWLVDPLDGTVNYLYRIPQYAVSVAAAYDGTAVCGVVVDVERDLTYTAVRGGGAFCQGARLACSQQPDPAFALVGTGFNYDSGLRGRQAQRMPSFLPRVRDIRRMGSAALDLCAVASGQLDAFFEAGMQPWDWAAAGLVATEAGARLGGLAGSPPGTNTTLAANPVLFDALHDLLVSSEV